LVFQDQESTNFDGHKLFAGRGVKVKPKRLRGLIAVLAALAMLAFVGSAATKPSTSKPNLTTVAGINAYLTSLGVDPTTVVRQIGPLNYAGPSSGCPGIGWNCTQATTVVQMAPAAGTNSADITCKANPPSNPPSPAGDCVIVQMNPSGNNKARCHEHDTTVPTASEFCTITQENGTGQNNANVDQQIDQNDTGGSAQDGRQYASVTQMNVSGDNQAQVFQAIHQDLGTGATQNQDGHQVTIVDQGGNGTADQTGKNAATVNQGQDQSEVDQGAAVSGQEQNTAGLPSDAHFTDCNPGATSGGVFVAAPNLCANITQDGTTLNDVYLDQSTNQDQRTTATSGHQIQGSLAGGLDGSVTQPTTGTANLHGSPTEAQSQRAPTGFATDLSTAPTNAQQQYDGNVCCATQSGKNSSVNIDQASNQTAVGSTAPIDLLAPATPSSDALQNAILFGHGMSEGSVTVSHSIKQNGPGAFTAQCPPKGQPPPSEAPTQTNECALFSDCTNNDCSSVPQCPSGQAFDPVAPGCEVIEEEG
jgi:hypothetical protein